LKYPSGVISSPTAASTRKRIGQKSIGTKGAVEIPEHFSTNAGSLLVTVEERREIPVAASDRYAWKWKIFSEPFSRTSPRILLAETLPTPRARSAVRRE